MERSIENIWKEGFESDKSLKSPLVKDLYTKKSKLIIDKIKSASKWDNLSLIPMALVLFGLFVFLGKMLLGFYLGALLILLFFLNKKMLKKVDGFNSSANTYLYLINYDTQLKAIQRFYTKLLAIGLPILIIPAYWLYFQGTPLISGFMGADMSFQILIVVAIALLLSGLGVLSYKLSTHVVYGKLIKRIEAIIHDMEELEKLDI
ncbi:hypothetical protein SAMN04487764_0404 [Gillisia sp. Hel1_33_143]|uniref:hypothetical protein n=1 Tax=Gillisia sp. Hel1_33_143 TaxID=1336796 RepID=UPI00087C988E|nr:hypothetical protein [Gillisia sp. Hel1_33_143]SDR71922.1 hypothetical protein SAMN04487764_0404 [Gillisia sp. Hel1_33_143]